MRIRCWFWVIVSLGVTGLVVVWLAGVTRIWNVSARGAFPADELEPVWCDPPLAGVQKRSWPGILRVQGNLVEAEEALIGAEVAGRVERVFEDIGTEVEAGQIFVQLNDEDYRLQERLALAQVQAIRARLGLQPDQPENALRPENAPPVVQEKALVEEARLALQRATVLHRLNRNAAISPEELDRLQAALQVAEARYASAFNQVREQLALLQLRQGELEQARKHLRDTAIRAPFAGVVQTRPPAPGTYLRVGDAVLCLVLLHSLRFCGKVPDRYTQQLRVGLAIQVWVEARGEPFATTVSRIEPTLMQIIEADVANPEERLPANTFAEVDLALDAQAQAPVLPRSAAWEFAEVKRVWKMAGDQLEEQHIRVGEIRGEWVEIVAALAEGERVLADAHQGRAGRKMAFTQP